MGLKRIQKHIFDHDYNGFIDASGAIKQVWGEEALNQSIKQWFASFTGDIIRAPQRGGYLTALLLKPMTSVRASHLEMAIRNGLYQDFTPYLTINSLQVKPNLENRYWYIYLEVSSADLKVSTVVEEKIRGRV